MHAFAYSGSKKSMKKVNIRLNLRANKKVSCESVGCHFLGRAASSKGMLMSTKMIRS